MTTTHKKDNHLRDKRSQREQGFGFCQGSKMRCQFSSRFLFQDPSYEEFKSIARWAQIEEGINLVQEFSDGGISSLMPDYVSSGTY